MNRYTPHVFVLPEDRANAQIANGFLLESSLKNVRAIQVMPPAGGWMKALDSLKSYHVELERHPLGILVLLVDFDRDNTRLDLFKSHVAESLRDRVFILGVYSEPEELKKDLGAFETIGKALAKDCAAQTRTTWNHALLQHNSSELDRMIPRVRSILFE